MYILINENKRPFAIVENNTNMRIEKAIAEEYSYEEVGLIGEIKLPDWGETTTIEFNAIDNGEEYINDVKIMKLVKY